MKKQHFFARTVPELRWPPDGLRLRSWTLGVDPKQCQSAIRWTLDLNIWTLDLNRWTLDLHMW